MTLSELILYSVEDKMIDDAVSELALTLIAVTAFQISYRTHIFIVLHAE
jgi:hypothetical protein